MFQKEVLQLIAANSMLKKYALTDKQWVLAKHLADVLVVGPVIFHFERCLCGV